MQAKGNHRVLESDPAQLAGLKLAKGILHTSNEVGRVLLPYWRHKLQEAGARFNEQRIDICILESPSWNVYGSFFHNTLLVVVI